MPSRPISPSRASFEARQRARQHQIEHFASHLVLRTNRFRYAGQRTLMGRAYLFSDRIELRHWIWRGRRSRRIPLTQILDLEYHPLDRHGNLSLVLETDEIVHLTLDEAHLWRADFEHWLSYAVLPSAKMMDGEADKAASLSG